MLPSEEGVGASRYASPEQLQIGLYVHIDLPWFSHPFTRGSFRISSDQQIRELRALNLPRYRYDPQRSVAALEQIAAASASAPGPREAYVAQVRDAGTAAAVESSDPRKDQLREYRKVVATTEKSFRKAVAIVRRLDKQLLSQPGDAMDEVGGLLDEMVSVFLDRSDVTLRVMGENCGGEEVYHHGLNVSVLCMMLIRGLALRREEADALGVGALLHDIGLSEIPDRIVKKSPAEQTKPERDFRARHVEFGVRIGRQLDLPAAALGIIEQHHELADGSGYPAGLQLDRIAPLARVVSLVNYYENLCNPVDHTHAMTPHEALSHLFARSRGQFDATILQLLIRSLGVYPPGSIVALSNDAIAMVISVNLQKPLRPWVLLYNAAVPKEEADLLNLEVETELCISRAIRPEQLPPQVYAYLNPRKRITYFFDDGPQDLGGG